MMKVRAESEESDDSAINIAKYWTYKTYKSQQERIVNLIKDRMKTSPEGWDINFEQLNNEGKDLL